MSNYEMSAYNMKKMSRADLELALKSEHDQVIYLRSLLDRQDEVTEMKVDKATAETYYEAYRLGIDTMLMFMERMLGREPK